MAIIEKIIQANQEGRKVTWPDPDLQPCIRCGEYDHLSRLDYCEFCHDDMTRPWPTSKEQ